MLEKSNDPKNEEEFIEVDVEDKTEEQISEDEIKLSPEEQRRNQLFVEILNLVNNNKVERITEKFWSLQEELAGAKSKQEEYLYTAQRVQADFENFKKRIQKDQEYSNFRNKSSILQKLTNLYEDLERTQDELVKADDLKSAKQAIKMIFESTKTTFESLGESH